jgi:hypothetical protein
MEEEVQNQKPRRDQDKRTSTALATTTTGPYIECLAEPDDRTHRWRA